MTTTLKRVSVLLLLLLLLPGCMRNSQRAAENTAVAIVLQQPLFPPLVGTSPLAVSVTDAATGEPINDATVTVKGDMTHAGMVPVLAEVAHGDNGVYKIPFEWTMAGDWIVTVTVTLADGTQATRTFDVLVDGSDATCGPETGEFDDN